MQPATTHVTVNNRLAQALRAEDAHQHLVAGTKVWHTPDIVSWSTWQQRAYESLVDRGFTDRVLLDAHQDRLLWEGIVLADATPGLGLLRPAAAARLAASAVRLCAEWMLEDSELRARGAMETRVFLRWRDTYRERLNGHGWLGPADLPGLLIEAARQDELEIPARLILHGFDDISPQMQTLIDTLREHGYQVDLPDADRGAAGDARLVRAADAEAECRMAANWVAAQLADAPDARIVLVSPELQQRRALLTRALRRALTPGEFLQGSGPDAFNTSLGQPLAGYAVVDAALLFLGLLGSPGELCDISRLLRSSFIGGSAGENDARASLDLALRKDGLPRLGLGRLADRARGFSAGDHRQCPDLAERLEGCIDLYREAPAQVAPSAWSGILLRLLETIGWPGDLPLDSAEFQAAERLRRLFSEFATLESVLPRMGIRRAIREFRRLAEETEFQPRGADARVQVLGVLESTGLKFDAAWVMGMDDNSWPPRPAPHPLLPAGLQRERGMPHGSAARELAFAQELTERLRTIAPSVIFSHPCTDGDRELRPSPLIAGLAAADPRIVDTGLPLYTACGDPGPTEVLPPPPAIPPATVPTGGSWLLAAQAACPFSAVAGYRLNAEAPEEPVSGPDARLRGNLVHAVLHDAWHAIGDSAQLDGLNEEELRALLDNKAGQVIADLGRLRPDVFTDAYSDLERARLVELLIGWFELERRRKRPFRIESLESSSRLELGGLPLKLRADRIDRLDDGSLLVIDYKTGKRTDVTSWTSDRPLAPQVPLYCIEQDAAAALVAKVRARRDETGFDGLARDADIVPGIDAFDHPENEVADWPALQAHWRQTLEALAREVMRGEAAVAPRDAGSCTWCSYGPLCRITQLQGEGMVDG